MRNGLKTTVDRHDDDNDYGDDNGRVHYNDLNRYSSALKILLSSVTATAVSVTVPNQPKIGIELIKSRV